jgi:hypothetical protein
LSSPSVRPRWHHILLGRPRTRLLINFQVQGITAVKFDKYLSVDHPQGAEDNYLFSKAL